MHIEITIPVYNEEEILQKSISTIFSFLRGVDFRYTVTIADNASNDKTLEIAKKLEKKYNNLKVLHTNKPEKGRSIKQVWTKSKAELLCFMDADLSTDLNHLKEMVHLLSHYDLVIGNRLSHLSKTKRSIHREILSILYNKIAKLYLNTKSHDLQCGFKGIKKNVFMQLAKDIKNDGFFFDTELIVWAEKKNYRIKEIPIKWTERKASKIEILKIINDYLIQLYYLKRRLKTASII